MQLIEKAKGLISDVSTYWSTPPKGKYVGYKGIFGYSFGGIGAYLIITMAGSCLLAANNALLSTTLAIDPDDMYIMYVIAVLANIPLTGIRANIIDNTRNKAGKYRPYIVSMAIPTAITCLALVYFPYSSLETVFKGQILFGEEMAYVIKCAIVMVLNLILHFFYYFFYDAYENLIHVLSPDTQERTNIQAVKSVVYSLAPSIYNAITPILAGVVFGTNKTDIRVYRLLFPILSVLGIMLCIVVFRFTEEKIVQAKSHVVQIKFTDALRAVAKNKYFWIISLAGWLGFLETSYGSILDWLYNYGGVCTGPQYSIVTTIYGNASLWGMLLAPFCIKKWGKKIVLIVTNLFNVVFILCMLPFVSELKSYTIWAVMSCLFLNMLMGSFAHILNPSIQADIRDYQQYRTGERIDGMFSAVATIGSVITLVTSSVLPAVYKSGGITKENAMLVTSRPEILNRLMGDGKTVGEILQEQLIKGNQNNYNNAYSALYDPDILLSLIKVLVILAAVGAFMNVIPYFWYDFNERKQKSVIRVLKVRALFEDYGNNFQDDATLIEGIDIIRNARDMAEKSPKEISKKMYKSENDKAQKRLKKAEYKNALEYNNEIEISKFVCDELDKFSSKNVLIRVDNANNIYSAGIDSLLSLSLEDAKAQKKNAKALPKSTDEEKELRNVLIEEANKKITAVKTIKKKFSGISTFTKPDFAKLEELFEREDEIDVKIKEINLQINKFKSDKEKVKALKEEIKNLNKEKKETVKKSKTLSDEIADFTRATKPYVDAEKLLKQKENYTHFDDIAAKYDNAKVRYAAELKAQEEEALKKKAAKAQKRKK